MVQCMPQCLLLSEDSYVSSVTEVSFWGSLSCVVLSQEKIHWNSALQLFLNHAFIKQFHLLLTPSCDTHGFSSLAYGSQVFIEAVQLLHGVHGCAVCCILLDKGCWLSITLLWASLYREPLSLLYFMWVPLPACLGTALIPGTCDGF